MLYTLEDLAALFKVSRSTIYRRRKEDNWPHLQIGSEFRFTAEDVQKNPRHLPQRHPHRYPTQTPQRWYTSQEKQMSTHTFSVLTSDVRRDPSILDRIHNHVAPEAAVTVTEHDEVTTVTAVAA